MYLPRRHVRRLLLPPGWVALGFLLLLGCQALLAHWRQLRLPNVMQITMPSSQPDKATNWGVPVYGSIAELNSFRPWRDAELTGTPISDFINAASAEVAIKDINADTSQAGGVRIRFGQHATYGNLVCILDMMNRLNQKRYWLDIHHKPTTFYAITNKPLPASAYVPIFICGTLSHVENYTAPPTDFTFQQILARLWQQAWRPSMTLFAVITGLSIHHLTRLRRPTR